MQLQSRSAPLLAVVAAFAVVYLVWGSTYLGIRIAVHGYNQVEDVERMFSVLARFT